MAEGSKVVIPRVKLGNQGLEVSKLGFGCMVLIGAYNSPPSEEDGLEAVAKRENPSSHKIWPPNVEISDFTVNGKPEYVRSCCEASLKRLDVEYIDLYYQHRVERKVPIEETIGELKKLVEEGKVKYLGLSEASPDTIRRAHAIHPITAVQMEWSLWTRDIEEETIPLCKLFSYGQLFLKLALMTILTCKKPLKNALSTWELGIGIVPYSPLGRGFFGGKGVVESMAANSNLAKHPRFQGDNLDKNRIIYTRIESLARKHRCTTAQLALAWVLHQGIDVVPIPGTTKMKNLDDNIGSLMVKLTEEDLKEISNAVPIEEIAGGRSFHAGELIWNFANTPPLN
ncbi:putative aldo-keto reductase 1 [Morella rubra]|uniref:Putative aldo-keto reductase 1 n=1 Tax=Morella rubra TaxID=262757 RepID=A0A6A1WQC2_9ROSI|nr:putative aldo-keto reductase 1 [Morella rubra]